MLYFIPTDTCFGLACAVSDPHAYLELYQLKQRSFDKPCAILVPDFAWLAEYTSLTIEQIHFLKQYNHPFTILADAPALLEQLKRYKNQNSDFFPNLDRYQQFAFRVAHHPCQYDLLAQMGPLFLTSANLSHQGEIYQYQTLVDTFSSALQHHQVTFV